MNILKYTGVASELLLTVISLANNTYSLIGGVSKAYELNEDLKNSNDKERINKEAELRQLRFENEILVAKMFDDLEFRAFYESTTRNSFCKETFRRLENYSGTFRKAN